MTSRLPPLTALRAFEAAARHLSFARAADELSVTPAALSFQIKSLEEHLGQPVFRRLNRAVELTEAGHILAPAASDGFAALTAGWHAAQRLNEAHRLTVTAGPGFTSKWLAPRMFRFAQAHPDIELRLSANLRLLDLARDDIDLAIRFGQGHEPDLAVHPLFDEWWTPMMAPALAAQAKTPEDLLRLPLLHQDEPYLGPRRIVWQDWFDLFGLSAPNAGLRIAQPDHAVDAAISGAGVLLGRASMSEGALRDGQLVAPFAEALRPGLGYRVVTLPGAETRAPVAAFLAWISAEIQDLDALEAGHEMHGPAGASHGARPPAAR